MKTNKVESRTQRQPPSRSSGIGRVDRPVINNIGIWIEGFDRLGAQYEGIWRVIKMFLLSSEGSGVDFCFVAAARFEGEIKGFLADLPEAVRTHVRIAPFGEPSDTHTRNEAVRQAVYANELDLDAWLVPNPMWAASKHLTRPKVVWFHDFLLAEFPQSYPRKLFVEFKMKVRDLKAAGAFFTFASPHVQEKHGREVCGIDPDRSMLVGTPSMDVSKALANLPTDPGHGGDLIRSELRDNLKTWCTPAHAELFYHHISSYPFESVPYFFVSSQNRAHKNFLRLAQIHAAMLRERYLPYPIFTTALVDIHGQSPLEKFLSKELHMGDFMSVGKVSDITHALLYKFARLTIHPSTFEGNLPFTFGESVSVGTPCILPYSRAYLHRVDPSMYPWVFYSPTEPGLIGKVQEVDNHREEFVAAQQEIWASLRSYDLKDYFKLLMVAFERSTRIEQKAQRVILQDEEADRPAQDRSTLTDFLRRLTGAGKPQIEDTEPLVQGRTWPRFGLARASIHGSDEVVMHLAEYLHHEQPKDSYYLMCVKGASALLDKGELRFGAEIGTWIDGKYVVSDRGVFEFGPATSLPSRIGDAFASDELLDLFCGDEDRVGWLKLGWTEGLSPEFRISGTPLPKGCSATASVASLSRASADLQRPPEEIGIANN